MENTTIKPNKLKKFLVQLRDIGKEFALKIHTVNDPNDSCKEEKQFIAAAMVAKEEIDNQNFSAITFFNQALELERDDNTAMYDRAVCRGRVAVLMNAGIRQYSDHGECRLLDPDRRMLSEILGEHHKPRNECARDTATEKFLHDMREEFSKSFGSRTQSILLMYSHYIPCTLKSNQCAKLVRNFVSDTHQVMVIGYEQVFNLTDKETASELLKGVEVIPMYKKSRSNSETRDGVDYDDNDTQHILCEKLHVSASKPGKRSKIIGDISCFGTYHNQCPHKKMKKSVNDLEGSS